jgi:hypothetical protein
MEQGLDQMLVLRDNAKSQLMQIQSVEEGISYLNKLSAIDKWVKAEKKDAELQNIVAEQKLRTQRILGELISEGQRKGIVAAPGGDSNMPDRNNRKTINEIGLSPKQSSTFQQIASIPEETFEEFIQEKKEAVNNAVAELTTTGAVKLAKSLKDKKKDLDDHLEDQEQLDTEKELKKMAQDINMNYTKEQRRFFVNLIKI